MKKMMFLMVSACLVFSGGAVANADDGLVKEEVINDEVVSTTQATAFWKSSIDSMVWLGQFLNKGR